jgi:hypothetical protein
MMNFEDIYSNFEENEEDSECGDDDLLEDPFYKTIEDIDEDDIPEIPDFEE